MTHTRTLARLDRYNKLRPLLRSYRSIFRHQLIGSSVTLPAGIPRPGKMLRVLIIGAYLGKRENTAAHLAGRFASAQGVDVTQAWASIGGKSSDPTLAAVTRIEIDGGIPKFPLMNRLLAGFDLREFDYVIVSDDDIVVPHGFLESFLALQQHLGFALAQPARTPTSCGSKQITVRERGLLGRSTRFVEIGPVFSVAASAFGLLFPFDESNAMGWGYDYHWPVLLDGHGLGIGVIDHTPVDHSIRPLANAYSGELAAQDMRNYLARQPHLDKREAEVTLQRYALP
ncbi:hypothetical protein [Uliginosibacterium sp. H1]|uniref:hypothetical protein n=1 Tax=Uliginosibacterium sp. H1 TaxID=3114757 RepID=UPI002E16DF88|nr:hypothetical protein [Uliginosibacterium sp. H1]